MMAHLRSATATPLLSERPRAVSKLYIRKRIFQMTHVTSLLYGIRRMSGFKPLYPLVSDLSTT